MNIIDIALKPIVIPFKTSFRHAAAERAVTESVITIVRIDSGVVGYGEGCPRQYVTGESITSVQTFFQQIKNAVLEIKDIASLKKFVTEYHTQIDANPAAWCSIETALLDALGKAQQQPIESVLGLKPLEGDFQYTGVLGIASFDVFQKQLNQYAQLGFLDFKVKLCGQYDIDKKNLDAVFALPNNRIRVDANNLWKSLTEAQQYLGALDYSFFAIEEPLPKNSYADLAHLSAMIKTPIILDESVVGVEQIQALPRYDMPWIINIRLSKMGGILRTLRVVEEANRQQYPLIIGAQVGETSILTRLAMTLANTCRNTLLAQEGAFGTYLLAHDIVENPIMFKQGGRVKALSTMGDGLGLKMIKEASD